ncbi:MAG: hypothetical protein V4549_05765 [Bacteroidota bacterium]
MNVVAVANKRKLEEYFEIILSEFHKYCVGNEMIDGVPIKDLITIKNAKESFEFECLGWNFCIKKDLYPFEGIAYLKTYEIIDNHNDYPNKKLEPLSEIDIVYQLRSMNFRFVKSMPKNVTAGRNNDGTYQPVSVDTSGIINFNKQFIMQLYATLQNKHKHL